MSERNVGENEADATAPEHDSGEICVAVLTQHDCTKIMVMDTGGTVLQVVIATTVVWPMHDTRHTTQHTDHAARQAEEASQLLASAHLTASATCCLLGCASGGATAAAARSPYPDIDQPLLLLLLLLLPSELLLLGWLLLLSCCSVTVCDLYSNACVQARQGCSRLHGGCKGGERPVPTTVQRKNMLRGPLQQVDVCKRTGNMYSCCLELPCRLQCIKASHMGVCVDRL